MEQERVVLDPDALSEKAALLERFLKGKIIGQERAIRRVVRAYEMALSPLREADKPILFALYPGPSGVGKTYMAKCLAEFFFGKEDAFTKIPCADYVSDHQIASLIGSPAGYVGYNDPPKLSESSVNKFAMSHLIEQVKKDREACALNEQLSLLRDQEAKDEDDLKKISKAVKDMEIRMVEKMESLLPKTNGELFSVVLFDEIEKAHPALHNFLLEVSAEGEASLQNGQTTSLRNSFILVTTNAGSKRMAKIASGARGSIGFANRENAAGAKQGSDLFHDVMEELKKLFPTELLGRMSDDIVIFHPLEKPDLQKIIEKQIYDVRLDLWRKIGANLAVSAEVVNMVLAEALEHPEYGARPIAQKILRYVRMPLATLAASEQIARGDVVFTEYRNSKIIFLRQRKARQRQESKKIK